MTDYEMILVEKSGPLATVSMNRPDRMNAMTNRMVAETGDALAALAEDHEIREAFAAKAEKRPPVFRGR